MPKLKIISLTKIIRCVNIQIIAIHLNFSCFLVAQLIQADLNKGEHIASSIINPFKGVFKAYFEGFGALRDYDIDQALRGK
jgi:hypothetical protein